VPQPDVPHQKGQNKVCSARKKDEFILPRLQAFLLRQTFDAKKKPPMVGQLLVGRSKSRNQQIDRQTPLKHAK
jgi:hypothetical protein